MTKYTKYLMPLAIIIAAVLIVQALYGLSNNKISNALSKEEAADKVVDFVSNVALQGESKASLIGVEEQSGLYQVTIKVEEQEYKTYISKDGKFLFPQGTDISEQDQEEAAEAEEVSKTDKPKVELFVMSFCPYGNQAEEIILPVVDLLGNKASINLHYVIYSNYQGGGPEYCLDEENKYCSMHGVSELKQGVRELCVQKYEEDKFWDFVKTINTDCTYQDVDSCWEGVAKKVGVNIAQVKECFNNEALDLLAEEVGLNEKYGIKGSPQLIINEMEYLGQRSSDAYKDGICSAFNLLPEECSKTIDSGDDSVSGNCE